jgi:methionyl-tRNA formyltransferase
MKRIVFMGTPDYATIIFEQLLQSNYNIVALFTQQDKPIGRKQTITPPHIKQFVINNNINIPIFQPFTLKDPQVWQQIKDLKPDIIIVAAYGQILPKEVLNIAPCINLHASLLPKYRGASPIQQALLNDDKYTGVTAMLMEEGLDSGDILGYKYLKIEKNMVVQELFDKLSILASQLTIETLERFEQILPKKQHNILVSYCKKVSKQDGLVDFDNAKILYNKYRAYKGWPDIFIDTKLKLKELIINEQESSNKKGEILQIDQDSIIIGCSKGSIKLYQVQPNSKKAMNVVDYIRGKRYKVGDVFC